MIKQKGSVHVILTIAVVATLICSLGLLYWKNYAGSSSSNKSAGYISTNELSEKEMEACRKQVAAKHPQPPRLSDHRDYSECSANIIPLDKLSEQQKTENKENTEVIMKARQNRNVDDCDKIGGMYFTAYPPDIDKVIMRTVDEAKEECRVLVNYEIKKPQRDRDN